MVLVLLALVIIQLINLDNNNYEIVIFESIFSTIYLKKIKFKESSKIIFRAHNIENKIWLDLATNHILKKGLYIHFDLILNFLSNSLLNAYELTITLSANFIINE